MLTRLPLFAVAAQVTPFEGGAHHRRDGTFPLLRLKDVSDIVYVDGMVGNLPQESAAYLAAVAGCSTGLEPSR